MTNWQEYKGMGGKFELADPIAVKIVERLGVKLKEFFKDTQGGRTIRVMDALSDLGKEMGFSSMANRISLGKQQPQGEFKKAEWLYDLHWYEEILPSRYEQTSMILTVECEWGYKRKDDENDDDYSAVKWDFQKLLVTNADLRLLIFKKRIGRGDEKTEQTNEALDKYFTRTIQGYRNLADGSKFLFIAFCDKAKDRFQYTLKTK
jgi:hypothetical protein